MERVCASMRCVCVCVSVCVCVCVHVCVCVTLAKHRATLTEGVTDVEGAPEVSEKLVAGSSDQLEQAKSSVLQVETEDEVNSETQKGLARYTIIH